MHRPKNKGHLAAALGETVISEKCVLPPV